MHCVQDPRVGWLPRVLGFLAIAYALSPLDLIPDFIPVLGLLDDLVLLPGVFPHQNPSLVITLTCLLPRLPPCPLASRCSRLVAPLCPTCCARRPTAACNVAHPCRRDGCGKAQGGGERQ